jgi:hypothetical protein
MSPSSRGRSDMSSDGMAILTSAARAAWA